MWTLIVISLLDYSNLNSEVIGTFDSIDECFAVREEILYNDFNSDDGYPPEGIQLVCVHSTVVTPTDEIGD